jgi:hypothetical protein
MEFKKYKKILYTLCIFLILFVNQQKSALAECNKNGYTILTINGIFTEENEAKINSFVLSRKLPLNYNGEKVIVDYLYNPTHLAGAGDIFDYIKQGIFDQKSDYDLTEILQDASSKIKTQKTLIVAHSQGNFYANNFYDKVADTEGGIPAESINVYSVASPTNHVAGNGKYITSRTDEVINKVRDNLQNNVLNPNTNITIYEGDDITGHSFSDIYLKYRSDRIVREIKESLGKLQTNQIQNENEPCMNPPQISLGHKLEKAIFFIADPFANFIGSVLNGIYNLASLLRDSGSNTVAWTYKMGKLLVGSAYDFTSSNLAEVSDSLSGELQNTNVGQIDFEKINNQDENKEKVEVNVDTTPIDINKDILNTQIEKVEQQHGGGRSSPEVIEEQNKEKPIESVAPVPEQEPEKKVEESVVIPPVEVPIEPTPIVNGDKLLFDHNNSINYEGSFALCDIGQHIIVANGYNVGITNYVNSVSWQTPYMQGDNSGMIPNVNYYFIFGSQAQSILDCALGTKINNYSETFYYKTNLGSSVVYGEYIQPIVSDPVTTPDPIPDPVTTPDPIPDPVVDNTTTPDVTSSPTIDPITPITEPVIPEEILPNILSYTFNDMVGDITVNPVENPMTFTMNANKNVDWVSIKIEKQDDVNVFKTFFSGAGCVDFTNTCTKTWNDTSKGLLSSGVYRVKVNIKDIVGNVYQDYLAPYVINVDMTLPKN